MEEDFIVRKERFRIWRRNEEKRKKESEKSSF